MRKKIRIDDIYFVMRMVFFDYLKEYMTKKLKDEIEKQAETKTLVFNDDFNDIPPFKYQNLLDQIETYKLTETPFDIVIHKIDNFMVDVYRTYCKMEILIHDSEGLLEDEEGMMEMGISESLMRLYQSGTNSVSKNFTKLRVIFNQIMLHYEFTETEIRGIQLNYLKDMLKESIKNEDFEECASIRDRINNF